MVGPKLKLRGFTEEEKDRIGHVITIIEGIASDSYKSLLEMEKKVDRVLTRTEIANILDTFIANITKLLNERDTREAIRESLIDYYYKERKEPYTVN